MADRRLGEGLKVLLRLTVCSSSMIPRRAGPPLLKHKLPCQRSDYWPGAALLERTVPTEWHHLSTGQR